MIFPICHLKMFEYSRLSMKLLFHSHAIGIEDIEWMDHESYVLYFEVFYVAWFPEASSYQ